MPPSASITFRPMARLRRSFTFTTDSTIRKARDYPRQSSAVRPCLWGNTTRHSPDRAEELGTNLVIESGATRHILDVRADGSHRSASSRAQADVGVRRYSPAPMSHVTRAIVGIRLPPIVQRF